MKVSRRWASLFVLASLTALVMTGLVGCSEEEVVDPYQYTSLVDIMKGTVMDTTITTVENAAGEDVEFGQFAFEIDAPSFDYVRGDVGIVRSGNQLFFFVAQNLENLYPRLQGALLGVKQSFSPQPTHLVLERIKRGGVVEADSMVAPTGYTLPKLLRSNQVDITEAGKNLGEAVWDSRKKTLDVIVPMNEGDDLLRFQTGIEKFVWVPKHDLPDSVKASPTAEDMAFYAVFPDAAFQIVDLAPGSDYMLHMLLEEDLPLVGSVTPVTITEDYQQRKIDHEVIGHVVGTLRLNWFKYANTFVQSYREEY